MGAILQVRFYDKDTVEWSTFSKGDRCRDLAVVVCEFGIILYQHSGDIEHHKSGTKFGAEGTGGGLGAAKTGSSFQKKISSKDLHDSRPLCAEPVSNRLLAIGCTDGYIRVWDIEQVPANHIRNSLFCMHPLLSQK